MMKNCDSSFVEVYSSCYDHEIKRVFLGFPELNYLVNGKSLIVVNLCALFYGVSQE